MTPTRTCPHCGTELTSHTGPGRPAIYCSPACRKKAHQLRHAAQLRGEPIRIIREPAPQPITHTIHRTRTVYTKPTRPELTRLLREDPAFLAEIIEDLSAFLNYTNAPKGLPQELAQRFGDLMVNLYQNQARGRLTLPGTDPKLWARMAAETERVEQFMDALHDREKTLEQQAQDLTQSQKQIQADRAELEKQHEKVKHQQAQVEQLRADARARYESGREFAQQWQQKYAELGQRAEEHQQEARRMRLLNDRMEQQLATTPHANKPRGGASFYRQ